MRINGIFVFNLTEDKNNFNINDTVNLTGRNWHNAIGYADIRDMHINKNEDIEKICNTLKDNKLKGTIHNQNKLKGIIKPRESILGTVSCKPSMTAIIVPSMISFPNYDGEYVIIPQTEEQILNTKNRITRENIEVKEIPYSETSNEYGYTITIA